MLVYIRGAGAVASGVALRLFRANCKIVMSDREHPLALRRTITFSEALRQGKTMVEDTEALAAKDPEEAVRILRRNRIAVIADPEGDLRGTLPFDAIVDAIRTENTTDTTLLDAPIVIGIGSAFRPGENCHAAVEDTGMRLGRVRYEGIALPDEKLEEGNHPEENTIFCQVPRDGLFYPVCEIGDSIKAGETIAVVDTEPVLSEQSGILLGILPEGTPVTAGMRCGEIGLDRREGELSLISRSSLSIGGGVLEALLHFREVY